MTTQTRWRSKAIGILLSVLGAVGAGYWGLVQAWADNVDKDIPRLEERLGSVELDVGVLIAEQVHMTSELERVHDTLKAQSEDQREFYRWFYTEFGTRDEARRFDQPADTGVE